MRSSRLLAVVALAAAAACSDEEAPIVATTPGSAPVLTVAEDAIDGAYIVVLNDGADPRSVAAVAGVSPKYVYTAALNGFAATLNQGQLNALTHNRNVAYIEQDARVSATTTTQTGATWGLDRVDQRNLPLNGTYTYTTTGASVRAYILDTGIHDHATPSSAAAPPWRATTRTAARGQDCHGHGTHVAGTVGGSHLRRGQGRYADRRARAGLLRRRHLDAG